MPMATVPGNRPVRLEELGLAVSRRYGRRRLFRARRKEE